MTSYSRGLHLDLNKGKINRQVALVICLLFLVIASRQVFEHFRYRRDVLPPSNDSLNVSDQSLLPSKDFQVPNIVHYIWYSKTTEPMKFHEMLSVLSAHKMLQPDAIYFHTDNPPSGVYWDRVQNLSRFEVVKRQPPERLFGEKLKKSGFQTSGSNVDRVKILMEHGGIYLDLDVLVVQSFDYLRKYPCTIGLEHQDRICGGIIVCSKDSPFLILWASSFLDDYRVRHWAYNSGIVPTKLANRFPNLVHVEPERLHRPSYTDLNSIWGPLPFDWRRNYAIHLWWSHYLSIKKYTYEPNEEAVKSLNNTFAQIGRMILYGT